MADEQLKKPPRDEIATAEKDIDIFAGWLNRLENPDPTLRTEAGGKGLKLYDEVDRDPHAGAVLQTRYLAVTGKEWEVIPGDESPEASRVADFVKHALAEINFDQARQEMLQAILYGYYPAEVMWTVKNGAWLPEKIRAKHPNRFCFTVDRELRLLTPHNMVDGEPVPGRKFIVFTYGSSDNPYGRGLGQKLWWPVWFKKNGIKFWLVFLEKFGMPTTVGKYPPGTPPDQQRALLGAIDAIHSETGVKIPNNMAIELLEAARTGKASYGEMCDYMDRQISKAVLGQTLTTEVKGDGSYAAGKVHNEVRGDILKADADLLCECLNVSLVRWIVDLNFPPVKSYPSVWVRTEEEADLKGLAERDQTLTKEIGLPVGRRYFYDTYGIPEPGKDEELVNSGCQGAEPPPAEFAEKGADPEILAAMESQDALDRLADEETAKAAPVFGQYIELVKAWFAGMEALEPAANRIAGLYDVLPAAPLAESLAGALAAADEIGAGSVPGEASFTEWGPGKPFAEAVDFFRAKAFTIAGVAKADLLADVKTEILSHMASGATIADFRQNLDDKFQARGWAPLHPHRVDTIYRTNMQVAYQAGRFRQMTSPAVLAERPYWRYVAVLDPSTRPAHAAMHGKIYRHDHPFWQTWYPPNGFNCRCTVQTVSARQMERRGWKPSEEDPTGRLFEPTDPVTGNTLPARLLMPDHGFSGRPPALEDMLAQKKTEAGAALWKERAGQPGPAGLGRPKEKEIPDALWKATPGKVPSLEERTRRLKQPLTEALAAIEADYRRIMGISPNETASVLKGPDGEIIRADLNSLAHAMLDRKSARERYLRYFRDVVENPYEILLTEYETAGGQVKYRKKYIGLYRDGKKESVVIVAEVSPEGWAVWNVMNARPKTIDRQRHGVEVLFGQ